MEGFRYRTSIHSWGNTDVIKSVKRRYDQSEDHQERLDTVCVNDALKSSPNCVGNYYSHSKEYTNYYRQAKECVERLAPADYLGLKKKKKKENNDKTAEQSNCCC